MQSRCSLESCLILSPIPASSFWETFVWQKMCVKICMTLVFGMKKAQQMGYVLCCASCCFLEHLCAAKQMCFHKSYIRPSGNVTMTGPSKRHSRCGVAHPVQMGKDFISALSDRNLRDPLPSQTGRSVRPVCSRLETPHWTCKLQGLRKNMSNSANIESGRKAFPEESTTVHPLSHQLLTAHL